MISQAMVARKPGSPGRARNKSKNHRAGNAGALAIPVVTMLVYFLLLYTGPRVWPKHPAFPAPSVEGDKTRTEPGRENAKRVGNRWRHSGMVRNHQTRNLEIPDRRLRAVRNDEVSPLCIATRLSRGPCPANELSAPRRAERRRVEDQCVN